LRHISTLFAAALVLAACQHQVTQSGADTGRAQPEAQTQTVAPAAKAPATAKQHMVAAANPLSARAGLDILHAGGSAVDAAIATQLALNVVEPQSSGIGGGGFMMHFAAASGEIDAFDGRETAPASATPDMFQNADGKRMKFFEAVPGGKSVGVPGLVHMMALAHKKHGKLPWARLFEPAIRLAETGFPVSPRLHQLISRDKLIDKFPSTSAYFKPGGSPLPVGKILINKPLAETFKKIATGGADAFYKGEIAEKIVRTIAGAAVNPGGTNRIDLAGYRSKRREPVCGAYRGHLVCGMPPPTSGGVAVIQILGILNRFDMASVLPGSVEAAHLIAEASRLAFADRNLYLADPDFIGVPVSRLIDPGYLAERAKLISPEKSLGKAEPGKVSDEASSMFAPDDVLKGLSTSHLVVVDRNGNTVSMTSSIENAFGSRLMAGGFLLNNQLTDFAFMPIRDGRMVANAPWPGKRPRSSMSPTLVFDRAGRPVLAIGSPGGSRIIGYVAQTIIAALDWGYDIQAAIDLPRIVNRNGPTELEKGTGAEELAPALKNLGHEVRIRPMTSGLHGIRIFGNRITGGADQRREGVALGD
jgi:gamma-glutamyltranspeptidase/glutathione hydrolase